MGRLRAAAITGNQGWPRAFFGHKTISIASVDADDIKELRDNPLTIQTGMYVPTFDIDDRSKYANSEMTQLLLEITVYTCR